MQAVIPSPAGRFDDLVKVAQISIEPATEAQLGLRERPIAILARAVPILRN
jgi:hypothetical protein